MAGTALALPHRKTAAGPGGTCGPAGGRAEGGIGRVRLLGRGESEEVSPGVHLPEATLRDEHLAPSFTRAGIFWFQADAGIFRGYQAHALQLRQEMLAFEDALPVDVDSPLALRPSCFRGELARIIGEVRRRLSLVEVPP